MYKLTKRLYLIDRIANCANTKKLIEWFHSENYFQINLGMASYLLSLKAICNNIANRQHWVKLANW